MVNDWVVFKYGDLSYVGEVLQIDENKVVVATLGTARFVISRENILFQGPETEVRSQHAALG